MPGSAGRAEVATTLFAPRRTQADEMTPIEKAFRDGDVFLDYPFERFKFRWEKRTQKVFRRSYGKPEEQISHTSNMYHDAISAGKLITREAYYRE